jgi:hypothetical protein
MTRSWLGTKQVMTLWYKRFSLFIHSFFFSFCSLSYDMPKPLQKRDLHRVRFGALFFSISSILSFPEGHPVAA